MRRILQEPLLHFLVLGAGLFMIFNFLPKPEASGEPAKIVISPGQVESIATVFSKTRQRPPTKDELEGLIRDRVREEVYYREALALGLDKDDAVIRRRLRQKLEFIADDQVAQVQPTDEELNAYLKANPDSFRVEPRVTFSQVYLNPEKHGKNLARDAARLLARLRQPGTQAKVSALGDRLPLDHKFDSLTTGEVARLFGGEFAARLTQLTPGSWQGPVESSYGVHLVFISKCTDGHLPPLAEVRQAVTRGWDDARRGAANEKYYEELLKRYAVTIESPQSAAEK